MRVPWLSRSVPTVAVDLGVHRRVYDRVRSGIAAHPTVEVGGKLIGTVALAAAGDGDSDATGATDPTRLRVRVWDYLDAGPRATRTATYHLPDGDYQVALFRAVEAARPEVEHLGSWHSHHPNGLATLSSGDIDGYLHTVHRDDYNLDVFIASLAIDAEGFDHARHWLFVRGASGFAAMNPAGVHVFDGDNPYAEAADQARDAIWAAAAEGHAPVDAGPWWETEPGRAALAANRRAIGAQLTDVRATLDREAGVLSWRGRTPSDDEGGIYDVALRYPAGFPEAGAVIELAWAGDPAQAAVRVVLPADADRVEALRAVLAQVTASGLDGLRALVAVD